MEISTSPENKFKTPEEEVAYLREKIAPHERSGMLQSEMERESQVRSVIRKYRSADSGKVSLRNIR